MNLKLLLACGAVLSFVAIAFLTRLIWLPQLPPPWRDGIRAAWHGYRVMRNEHIQMRDGVRLSANVYLPLKGPERLGTVLIRLPYGKDEYSEAFEAASEFATRGFAVVVQDMRGKFASEGVYVPLVDDGEDGWDTLDWIVRQRWSNGKVGTFGCSALGESQMVLATLNHPAHSAVVAQADGGAVGRMPGRLDPYGWYEGGIFSLASGFGWFLRSGGRTPTDPTHQSLDMDLAVKDLPSMSLVSRYRSDPTGYELFLGQPFSDAEALTKGYVNESSQFSVPALRVSSWHDQAIGQSFVLSALIEKNRRSADTPTENHLIVAPGNHCAFHEIGDAGKSGDMPIGSAAKLPYWDWYVTWFRHWLSDSSVPLPVLPRYLVYVTGEDAWISADQWPPQAAVARRLLLNSAGSANTLSGDGRLSELVPDLEAYDEYVSDPADPVPTTGGPFCCAGNPKIRSGSVDQQSVERRADVLVYTSAALTSDLRIAGPLQAELVVSASTLDADLVARLVDVSPDGLALNIQEGALRLRYRNGFLNPQLLKPGERYRVVVDMRSTAHLFRTGHRLRLQITSSSFPRLERNMNTGEDNGRAATGIPSTVRVYHGPTSPSALVFFALPEATGNETSQRLLQ